MFRRRAEEEPKSKLEQRVARLSDRALYEWAGTSLNTIGLAIESNDDFALDEAEKGAEQLLAVVRQMKERRA